MMRRPIQGGRQARGKAESQPFRAKRLANYPAGNNCMQWVTNVTYCAEGARRRRPAHDHTSTAPKAPAEGGRHTSTVFLLENAPISLKNTIFSKGAFGVGLRPP